MRRVGLVLLLAVSATAAGSGSVGAAASRIVAPHPHGPAIAVGDEFACGLSTNETVKCWGSNGSGALGPGRPNATLPVTVSGISGAVAIAAASTTCVVLASGVVKCWGTNTDGLRGDGTTTTASSPTAVTGITTAIAVSVDDHACALLKNGTIACWGSNSRGELGNGALSPFSPTPVLVQGITNAVAISTGGQLSCAVLADGTARCWGRDSGGALGTGGPALGHSATPVRVKDIAGAVSITSLGSSTCVLLTNRNVKCWGSNISGELGNGSRNYGRLPGPVTVKKLSNAVNISLGAVGCAAITDGTAKCWGTNSFGLLGTGRPDEGPKPADLVTRISHVVKVSVSVASACALIVDGTVRCWGTNSKGQFGNGTTSQLPSKPVPVKGLSLGHA